MAKFQDFQLVRWDSDDDKVWDWAEPRYIDEIGEDGKPTGNQIQEHLYVKTLFIGSTDSIENYIEVIKPSE